MPCKVFLLAIFAIAVSTQILCVEPRADTAIYAAELFGATIGFLLISGFVPLGIWAIGRFDKTAVTRVLKLWLWIAIPLSVMSLIGAEVIDLSSL